MVAEGGHGRDLAASLRLSERTLLRWAEQADLPPPRRILAWMRVLLACELLDDPGQTVLSVAYTCGYASDSSLRRAVQEFTGVLLTELRQQGAFATASDKFRRAEDTRESGRNRYVQGRELAAREGATTAGPPTAPLEPEQARRSHAETRRRGREFPTPISVSASGE